MNKTTTSAVPEPNNHAGVCPSCGYCPTCGRKNAQAYPWWGGPVWVYPYWYTHGQINTGGSATISYQTTSGSAPQFTLTGGTFNS